MDAKAVLAMIKEKDVKFVDFRFTDPRGKWQHTARMASATDEDTFTDGVMFDGSSISGWKAISDFNDVKQHLTVSGGDLIIKAGDDWLTVDNLQKSGFTAADVDFMH